MDSNTVILILGGLIVTGLLLGVILRATQTRVRRSVDSKSEHVGSEIFEEGARAPVPFGERLTLVQFSTETCARCPATARTLAAAASERSGITHIEVDVSRRDELIERFSILRTPTVLVIDAQHRLLARVSGPVGAARARELLDEFGAITPAVESVRA